MSSAQSSNDLEARVAELEQRIAQLASPRPLRRRRSLAVLVTLIVVTALPMVAIASDNFADVPTGHLFHEDINRLYGSRITAGCGGSNFCPDAAVTRGQMAAFLNRALGRISRADVSDFIDGATSSGSLGSVTIRANNVTGGTAFVQVIANFNLFALEAEQSNCECELYFWIEDEGGATVSSTIYTDFDVRSLVADNDTDLGVTVLGAQQVPTGVTKTYTVRYGYPTGTSDFYTGGWMTATTYAFAGDGSNSWSPGFTAPTLAKPEAGGEK